MTIQHESRFLLYHRASHAESFEQRYHEIIAEMQRIGPPFSLAGLTPPPMPECPGAAAHFRFRYPSGAYLYCSIVDRTPAYQYRDQKSFDDLLCVGFNMPAVEIDYRATLFDYLPKLVKAYRAYHALSQLDMYALHYWGGLEHTNPVFNRLAADPVIDIDGRNNIFTLSPAQYWDAELCRRALGYGPEEVIRRLDGQVPRVEPLMDGVYTVFNDDPDLTYDDFVAMNERYKRILGLTERERVLMATPLQKDSGA
ncbi:MAG TPA: hypothetical protein VN668_08680 [Stellaceae bacterium]|nr:hypothetical protein [Stellaceae bacterium]